MEELYKIFDPVTRTRVNAVKRKYTLKMKAGTTGKTPTEAEAHVPEIFDFLKNRAADWWVNQAEGTIEIACPESTHDIVAQTQTRFRG